MVGLEEPQKQGKDQTDAIGGKVSMAAQAFRPADCRECDQLHDAWQVTPWDSQLDLLCREAGGFAAGLAGQRFHLGFDGAFMVASSIRWECVRAAIWA